MIPGITTPSLVVTCHPKHHRIKQIFAHFYKIKSLFAKVQSSLKQFVGNNIPLPVYLYKRYVRNNIPLIAYRHPPRSRLTPDLLYAWFDIIWKWRQLEGDILEVGCDECGTSYLSHIFLKNTGISKRYICVDTFEGFVPAQLENETQHGLHKSSRYYFASSRIHYVRRLLNKYGANEIELVKGDIVSMPDSMLPTKIAACLLDVDLEIPIYEGLKKIFPKIVKGGAILIDNCEDNSVWRARIGWQRFIQENGLPENKFMGMALVEKPY